MANPETVTTQRLAVQIAGDLTQGVSVLLTGLPGSGRSYVAEAVAHELSLTGAGATRLHGNRALADRPLAALSLAGVDLEEPASNGSVLTRTASAFRTLVGRANSVLILDDADDLDPASIGVITDLRARRAVPALIVTATGGGTSTPVADLVAACQPGVTVALPGLPLEDVTHLTNHLLDGIVAADTISRIATLSGGLPGLIRAIVRVGRRSGWLTLTDGVWAAGTDLWDPGLQFALLPLVRGLTREDLEFLAQVAAARGASLHQAEDWAGVGRVRKLARRGLLHLGRDEPGAGEYPVSTAPAGSKVPEGSRAPEGSKAPEGSRAPEGSVTVYPPALAEWLRRGDGAVAEPEAELAPAVRLGGWPASLTGPEAAALAERYRTHLRSDAAQRWVRWCDNPVPKHAVPLLAALLSGTSGDERIGVVLAKTVRGDDETAYTEYVVLTAVYRATWEHDLRGALALLARRRADVPGADAYIRSIECRLILNWDRVPPAATMALPADGWAESDALFAARAEVMIVQGRVQDALNELALIGEREGRSADLKRSLEALATVLSGDATAGAELAVEQLRRTVNALDPHTIPGEAYVAALGLAMCGRFAELEAVVEIVHRLVDTSVFQNHLKAGLFVLGAFVADWEGRRDYARNLALQARALGVRMGPLPGMLANQDLLFHATIDTVRLWDEIDEMYGRGFLVSAIFLAVAAIELDPGTTRADALIEQGAVSQSRVVRALARYVATVHAGNPDAYGDTIVELREACGPLDSTRALISWAMLLRQRGDQAGWLDRAAAAWREARHLSRTCDGLFDRLVDAVDLTAREQEVTNFVTVGLSSPEIAARLGVSTRTVEAYLRTIFRKTGVNTRDDLRQLARTWLHPRG